LEQQAALAGDGEQPLEVGMAEVEGLVPGVDPQSGHAQYFVAAADVVLPVGPREIDRAEGLEQAGAAFAALGGEAFIGAAEILVEQGLEAAGPGLDDPVLLQFRDQGGRIRILEMAERPLEQVDVGVDDAGRGAGGRGRGGGSGSGRGK
jgi:hypothetical protein